MAIRFRKSFKLAPGVRMNLSGSGAGFSFGPRGASVSVGKRGVYGNVGIPGTGLSSRSKLSGGSSPTRRSSQVAYAPPQTSEVALTVGIDDDGTLSFRDQQGAPLPEHYVEQVKKQHPDAIKGLIQRKCDEINSQIEAIGNLHHDTPEPTKRPVFQGRKYAEPPPVEPVPRVPSFVDKLFKSKREHIEADNRAAAIRHQEHVDAWEAGFARHRETEAKRRQHIEELIYTDLEAMETHLEDTLQDIAWPRETLIAAELIDGGRTVYLDVDLPEIEDMPNRTATVPQRGMKLSVKDMTATAVQKLYMQHVHSIAFRIIGETFAALPEATCIVLSGYSQRRDKATGVVNDEYLYSVNATRSDWNKIEFSKYGLQALDAVQALDAFNLRRNMSKTGVFKPIEPFSRTE